MKLSKLVCLLFVPATLLASPAIDYRNSELQPTLQRKKRYLAFPKGSSLQLVYCFLVAALGTQNFFTVGITLGVAWEIPTDVKSLIIKNISPNSIKRRDARDLYPSIEGFLHRLGVNGQACVLRAICEATYSSQGNVSFIEEILHTIFLYPETDESDQLNEYESSVYENPQRNKTLCLEYYNACPTSLLDINLIN